MKPRCRSTSSGNWAGGDSSTLEADFDWMYDDGLGSGNLDCTPADQSGCWGHRHDTVYPFDPLLLMGAAEDLNTNFSPSLAELFIGGDSTDTPLDPTWATITSSLPIGVSTTMLEPPTGTQSAQLNVWASGENMNVTAAITAGDSAWTVSPAGCNLNAGSSCTLTLAVNAALLGTDGTLTLTGPNGNQTVALHSQIPTTLSLSAGAGTTVAGIATTTRGRFVFSIAPTSRGRFSYHAVTTAGGSNVVGTSPAVTLRVH
jgi:hypothetical protein